MPTAARRVDDATELETAPFMRPANGASASMKWLTVDPVPTPRTARSGMKGSAARAAIRFLSSALAMMVLSPMTLDDDGPKRLSQKRLCPLARAQSFRITLGDRIHGHRVRAYFFLAAFFLAFFFAFAMLALQ